MAAFKSEAIIWLWVAFGVLRTCHSISQCSPCNCQSDKKVDCAGKNLGDVPALNQSGLNELILNNNTLRALKKNVFLVADLYNLHKLYLKNCLISNVDKDAFNGLEILIHLDLSFNEIESLDSTTFTRTQKLRILNLKNNRLQKLGTGLFRNLLHLQNIDLTSNRLSSISEGTFSNLNSSLSLWLTDNQLSGIDVSIFREVKNLGLVELSKNPLKCDCQLRDFFVVYAKVVPKPIYCSEPEHLRNRTWTELRAENFACKPEIVWSNADESDKDKWMLSCKVVGDPKPETYWNFNGRILTNSTLVASTTYELK